MVVYKSIDTKQKFSLTIVINISVRISPINFQIPIHFLYNFTKKNLIDRFNREE